jgi:protein disulfide-isomerase A6
MASMSLMLCFFGAANAALELTPDNFDKEVFASGKSAFIKFLAPW